MQEQKKMSLDWTNWLNLFELSGRVSRITLK